MVTVLPVIDRPPPSCKTEGEVRELSSNGVMEEGAGKVQRASTYSALALPKREIDRERERERRSERSEKFYPTG